MSRSPSSGDPRSHTTANASPPASLIAATVSAAGKMSPIAIACPASASRSAIARPIPRAAPVTRASLISREVEAEGGIHDVRYPVGHLVFRQPDFRADQVVNPLKHHQAAHRGQLGVLLMPPRLLGRG